MYADFSRRGWVATLVCAAAVAVSACSKPAPAPEPVRAVRTLIVAADSASGVREYAAEVRARTESRLGFRVAGKMVQRTAELGQQVRVGQVLARLDATDLKLGQDAALAASRAAQTNFELAAAEFKRYQELRAQGFISGLELERREAALKAQQAQRDQALAQAGVQGNQAGYAVLTAPAAGVITGVDADVGAVLAFGASVLRLAHDGPRDAVFAVPEDHLAGMRARLGKPGALKVRPWNGGAVLAATVREVAAAADPVTRTYLVKADLGKAAVQLGQTVTVLADLPRRDGVVRLPLTAVMQQQGQTAVWVVDPSRMTVQVQPVVVAGADGNTVVVASGLSPGQVVVTAGVHVLMPGQQVKYYVPPGAAAAASASTAASR
ncbi:MAG: efflux RND transporter periplasmic adaptor subunit [Betaproteobacteria bacterium]|nr:efflux RND transporter periplasmic adaptor subunit [Betaproteobacteria bacterium]